MTSIKSLCFITLLHLISFYSFGQCDPQRDSLVLIDLYNSTDGPNWVDSWDLSKPVSTWDNIQLSPDGCVTSIRFSNNTMSGELPATIVNLSELRTLFILRSQLSGSLPEGIQNLSKLLDLILDGNMLSGQIPESIVNLKNCRKLVLSNNEFSGELIPQLSSLENLTELRLNHNMLSGTIPASFGQFKSLEKLNLSQNLLTGSIPQELSKLESLVELKLNGNPLTGSIPDLTGLSNLERLYCDHCQLSGSIPPQIGNLSSLTHINFQANQLSGTLPEELFNLDLLQSLILPDNMLTGSIPTSIGNLSKLTVIGLSYNQLSGEIPSTIGNLKELRTLSMGRNMLSGELPNELAGLLNIESIHLTTNQLSGKLPPGLGLLPKLEQFLFQGNDISGCYPADYVNLCGKNVKASDNRKLPYLGLFEDWCASQIQIGAPCSNIGLLNTDEVIQEDCSCGKANVPSPNDCHIKDSLILVELYTATGGPDWILNWDLNAPVSSWNGIELHNDGSVKEIFLPQNNLLGTIPPSIGELCAIEKLYLSNNQISGNIPPSIGNLINLQFLYLSSNNFAGTIPDEIYQLTELKELYLGHNNLNGTLSPLLGQLQFLVKFNANHNQLSGQIPQELFNLTSLIELSLGNNNLTGSISSDIGKLTELRHLYLISNKLSGEIPTSIGTLINLVDLRLFNNEFSGTIPDLSSLSQLRTLWLHSNQLTGTFDVNAFPTESLKELKLGNNNFSGSLPEDIIVFTVLEELDIAHNQFTGCYPDSWSALCTIEVNTSQNTYLPFGGDFRFFCNGDSQIGSICNNLNRQREDYFVINESCECVDPDVTCDVNDTSLDCDEDGVLNETDCAPTDPNIFPGKECDDNDLCTIDDQYNASCECLGIFEDTDSDGVCDAEDLCPDIDNDIINTPCDDGNPQTSNDRYSADCKCVGTACDITIGTDDCDGDGILNGEDCAPNDPNPVSIGTVCDDGDACTINDVIDADCNCSGIIADEDKDGVCDVNDLCPGIDNAIINTPCDDGDPQTSNDKYSADCKCVGTACDITIPTDDCDGDGILNGDDCTPNNKEPTTEGSPCDDLNRCTIQDKYDAECNCTGTFADEDNDGVCDADDACNNLLVGTACDDNNPNTQNDVLLEDCICKGSANLSVVTQGSICLGLDQGSVIFTGISTDTIVSVEIMSLLDTFLLVEEFLTTNTEISISNLPDGLFTYRIFEPSSPQDLFIGEFEIISDREIIQLQLVGLADICDGQAVEITTIENNYEEILWSTGEVSNQINISDEGRYWVRVINASGCVASDTFDIRVAQSAEAIDDEFLNISTESVEINILENDSLPTSGNWEVTILQEPEFGILEELGNGLFNYKAEEGQPARVAFTYQVCDLETTCQNNCNSATVSLQLANTELQTTLEAVITPNGDGMNEVFDTGINDIESQHPNNEIIIFNRWGQQLFMQNPYDNQWAGTNQSGNQLPQGTYYFVLRLKDNVNKEITGDILLIR